MQEPKNHPHPAGHAGIVVRREYIEARGDWHTAKQRSNKVGDRYCSNVKERSIYAACKTGRGGRTKKPLVETDEGKLNWGFGGSKDQLSRKIHFEVYFIASKRSVPAMNPAVEVEVDCDEAGIKGEGGYLT